MGLETAAELQEFGKVMTATLKKVDQILDEMVKAGERWKKDLVALEGAIDEAGDLAPKAKAEVDKLRKELQGAEPSDEPPFTIGFGEQMKQLAWAVQSFALTKDGAGYLTGMADEMAKVVAKLDLKAYEGYQKGIAKYSKVKPEAFKKGDEVLVGYRKGKIVDLKESPQLRRYFDPSSKSVKAEAWTNRDVTIEFLDGEKKTVTVNEALGSVLKKL